MRRSLQSVRGPSQWLTWIGVFVLLTAGSIQACHVCGLDGLLSAQHSISLQVSAGSSGSICPICLSSQPATSASSIEHHGPALALTPFIISDASSFYPAEAIFSLSIRPPPAH